MIYNLHVVALLITYVHSIGLYFRLEWFLAIFGGGLWEGWLCHSLGSFPGGKLSCLQVSIRRAASQS